MAENKTTEMNEEKATENVENESKKTSGRYPWGKTEDEPMHVYLDKDEAKKLKPMKKYNDKLEYVKYGFIGAGIFIGTYCLANFVGTLIGNAIGGAIEGAEEGAPAADPGDIAEAAKSVAE